MDNMLTVTVYADTTGYFTEKQIDTLLCCNGWGNIADILVPESVVREYYKANSDDGDPSFDEWFKEIYCCDDMDGLVEFAIEKTGKRPELAESYYNDLLWETLEKYSREDDD